MYRTTARWGEHRVLAGAALALLVVLAVLLPAGRATRGAPLAAAVPLSATGANAAAIDGVPDAASAPNNLPLQIFNVTSPRGVVFSTPGIGFQVSAGPTNPTATPVEFGNLNPTYPTIFQTFSPPKLFTPLGSNLTDVTFFVAGSTTPATVSGFGAVFTNVANPNTTSIQYFDFYGTSLGTFFVPATAGGKTLSFLGVTFNAGERVGRVRITTGTTALGPNDAPPGTNIVVMDDFIYGEPVACIQADINCDGIVDIRDYAIWHQHFGQTPP